MYGKFCSTLQGNAGNSSKGLNKCRSILGRSFHIDLIPRHFLDLCDPSEMASKDVSATRGGGAASGHFRPHGRLQRLLGHSLLLLEFCQQPLQPR
jgi:hypothetical protein